MNVEGVKYSRFRVAFRDEHGKRVRWIRWSPAVYFLGSELAREFSDRGIAPRGDVRITELAS